MYTLLEDEDQQKVTPRGRLLTLVDRSAPIIGPTVASAASAFITSLLPGPEGAALAGAVGTAVATTFESIGNEISSRGLAPREQARVGSVFALAAREIVQRCETGEQFRDDGFFDRDDTGRSDAEEVWESVLLKAQRDAEEKKLPYMAHLFANLAFDSDISAPMGHQMAKAAEAMTYRQFCILRLSAIKENFDLRNQNYRGQGTFPKDVYQLLYEYYDLYSSGLINFGDGAALSLTHVNPGAASLQGIGADLYVQMRLHRIPKNELQPIATQLQ